MSDSILLTILVTAPPGKHDAIQDAIAQNDRGRARPLHEVWHKRYSGQLGPTDVCFGSIREVGLGDPVVGHAVNRLRAVANQTRRRVIAAGAQECTVTAQDLDDTPFITLLTDGSVDR